MKFNIALTTAMSLLLSQINAAAVPKNTNSIKARDDDLDNDLDQDVDTGLNVDIIKYTSAGNRVGLVVNGDPQGKSHRFEAVWANQAKTEFRVSHQVQQANYLTTTLPHLDTDVDLEDDGPAVANYADLESLFLAAPLPDVSAGQDCYQYIRNCLDLLEGKGFIERGEAAEAFAELRHSPNVTCAVGDDTSGM